MAYSSENDCKNIIGTLNLAFISSLDQATNPPVIDSARVLVAIAYADSVINVKFQSNNVANPVPSSNANYLLITDISACFAIVWMYENLGLRDEKPDFDNKMVTIRTRANAMLDYLCLPGILGADQVRHGPNAPVAVTV